MAEPSCDICGGRKLSVPAALNTFLQTEPDNELLRCDACALLFRRALPEVADDDIGQVSKAKGFLTGGEYAAGSGTANRRMRERLDGIKARLSKDAPRVLDIGCGTGSFVRYATESGWQAVGTDINDRIGDRSVEGLKIIRIDVTSEEDPSLPAGGFDLVHLNHVLEHAISPSVLAKKAAEYVAEGGFLCVEVPNEIVSLAARTKRLLGRRSNSPTAYFGHRSFFDRGTFLRMLEITEMAVVQVRTPFINDGYGFAKVIFDRLQSTIGQGATLEVLLQKR